MSSGVRAAGGVAPARIGLVLVVVAGIAAGLLATGDAGRAHAVAAAGPELTRLLRAMAAIKSVLSAAAVAAVLWRLGAAVRLPWFAGYAAAAAAMAAGPGLIWDMAHVGAGALVLHGGLLMTIVLLWRDPVMAARLSEAVAARRRAMLGPAGRRTRS
jgi:hypothetical protein